jgi:hypothetical protein
MTESTITQAEKIGDGDTPEVTQAIVDGSFVFRILRGEFLSVLEFSKDGESVAQSCAPALVFERDEVCAMETKRLRGIERSVVTPRGSTEDTEISGGRGGLERLYVIGIWYSRGFVRCLGCIFQDYLVPLGIHLWMRISVLRA